GHAAGGVELGHGHLLAAVHLLAVAGERAGDGVGGADLERALAARAAARAARAARARAVVPDRVSRDAAHDQAADARADGALKEVLAAHALSAASTTTT